MNISVKHPVAISTSSQGAPHQTQPLQGLSGISHHPSENHGPRPNKPLSRCTSWRGPAAPRVPLVPVLHIQHTSWETLYWPLRGSFSNSHGCTCRPFFQRAQLPACWLNTFENLALTRSVPRFPLQKEKANYSRHAPDISTLRARVPYSALFPCQGFCVHRFYFLSFSWLFFQDADILISGGHMGRAEMGCCCVGRC